MKKYRIVKETGEETGLVCYYVQGYIEFLWFGWWMWLRGGEERGKFKNQKRAQEEIDDLLEIQKILTEKITREIIKG